MAPVLAGNGHKPSPGGQGRLQSCPPAAAPCEGKVRVSLWQWGKTPRGREPSTPGCCEIVTALSHPTSPPGPRLRPEPWLAEPVLGRKVLSHPIHIHWAGTPGTPFPGHCSTFREQSEVTRGTFPPPLQPRGTLGTRPPLPRQRSTPHMLCLLFRSNTNAQKRSSKKK